MMKSLDPDHCIYMEGGGRKCASPYTCEIIALHKLQFM